MRYVESFQNKRKDSNEYKEAVHFLNTYFHEINEKVLGGWFEIPTIHLPAGKDDFTVTQIMNKRSVVCN